MTYEEGSAIREKWANGAVAEYHGFVDAATSTVALEKYTDPYQQQRYEQGFADGRAMRMHGEVKV